MDGHRRLVITLAVEVAGPAGFVVYHPGGERPMAPKQLVIELVTDLLAGLLAAFLLSRTVSGFGGLILLATLLGVFSWSVISVPYWNWYRFPSSFTAAAGIEHGVGWFLSGFVLASIVRKPGK